MEMTWSDLLFAHWPVDVERIRALTPAALELDLFDGRAWLGVVPFRMSGVRKIGAPALGFAEEFLELNLRTYVRHRGEPGVWFFSLDAESALAVAGARALFHLPYFTARMRCHLREQGVFDYRSERAQPGAPSAEVSVRYAPCGAVSQAERGTLEHFLVERYRLYAIDTGGRVLNGEIDHAPWPLQPARAEFEVETLSRAAGFEALSGAPVAHFAARVDVRAWAPIVVD